MGKYVFGDAPGVDALVEGAIAGIKADIDAIRPDALAGVVLGGGYGRGEGGVWERKGTGNGERGTGVLSNDLDFFAVTAEGADERRDVPAIAAALDPVSKKWKDKLGVDIDFAVKTPQRLKHDERRIMVQELLRGHVDVWGVPAKTLFAGLREIPADELPWTEAARLLVNRGAGLLMAGERGSSFAEAAEDRTGNGEFVNRNLNKCILGAGDARLVAKGSYRWELTQRADATGDRLYSDAAGWKSRPRDEAVCTFDEARDAWLSAAEEVLAAPGRALASKRTLREAARWIVRRRTLGRAATFGMDATLRVLVEMREAISRRDPFGEALRKDWMVFN